MYSTIPGAYSRQSDYTWIFPHPEDHDKSGAKVQMAHLEHESDKLSYQGAQIPLICFDELTHFTESMFVYLMSRNRSANCGFRPYIRATTNPERDSWVKRWISWYLDDDGYAIEERSGVLRYFIRIEGEMIWEDSNGVSSREALFNQYGISAGYDSPDQIKSFTFIPSKLSDNKLLMKNDPSYKGSLLSLDKLQRALLLDGNWNAKAESGTYFQRGWVDEIDFPPARLTSVRYWDRAATEPSNENPDPDWTVGLKMGVDREGYYIVTGMDRFRKKPAGVQAGIVRTANMDGKGIRVCLEQDPGAAGKSEADNLLRLLSSFDSRRRKVTKDKVTRFLPFSAACENGMVKVVKGDWNEAFYSELENFIGDDTGHDDIVDTCSGAYNELEGNMGTMTIALDIPMSGIGKLNMFDINRGL